MPVDELDQSEATKPPYVVTSQPAYLLQSYCYKRKAWFLFNGLLLKERSLVLSVVMVLDAC